MAEKHGIPALISFFIPGAGQLIQGRMSGIFQFIMAVIAWFFLLGWIVHIWSAADAYNYEEEKK